MCPLSAGHWGRDPALASRKLTIQKEREVNNSNSMWRKSLTELASDSTLLIFKLQKKCSVRCLLLFFTFLERKASYGSEALKSHFICLGELYGWTQKQVECPAGHVVWFKAVPVSPESLQQYITLLFFLVKSSKACIKMPILLNLMRVS